MSAGGAASVDAPPALLRALVLRSLGAVFLAAFGSLGLQLGGLLGAQGIAPVPALLARAQAALGAAAVLRVPTLFWIDASDVAQRALWAIGVLLALVLAAGRAPRLALAGLWLAYLSFVSVGSPFFGYQWDALLLETALLALVLATPTPGAARAGIWLLRALLAKLMLLSGLVKLLSGDPAWRDGSALAYHYWTQPLPTWTSALADALPLAAQRACGFATLAIEIGAPALAFGPRPLRLGACAALVLLQLAIAATGSYGFFNLLALVLCLTLLDDALLGRLRPAVLRGLLARPAAPRELADVRRDRPLAAARRGAFRALVGALFALGALAGAERVLPPGALPEAAETVLAALAPLRSWNGYGLFAVMTKERPEIELEGSRDGVHWSPYVFRWKPGPVDRSPGFATPHMPRLDWQMWFAALGSCAREPWLHAFVTRLLEGSPAVSGLLAHDPFAGDPPRYVRSTLWRYRFASAQDRARGAFWSRERVEAYCPTLMLEGGRLALAPELGE